MERYILSGVDTREECDQIRTTQIGAFRAGYVIKHTQNTIGRHMGGKVPDEDNNSWKIPRAKKRDPKDEK